MHQDINEFRHYYYRAARKIGPTIMSVCVYAQLQPKRLKRFTSNFKSEVFGVTIRDEINRNFHSSPKTNDTSFKADFLENSSKDFV